jgi:hypothetical protein
VIDQEFHLDASRRVALRERREIYGLNPRPTRHPRRARGTPSARARRCVPTMRAR